MEDHQIIELFSGRSEQAIAQLAAKYGKLCLKLSENILKNPMDAEECVNDAYFAVWNTIPPQKPDSLAGYLCRIVRNISIKKYHTNTAQKRNSFYDIALSELEECIPASENVENESDAKELVAAINHVLRRLTKENRIIFVRRYWFSDSIPALAKMFRTSEHNISVRLSRTRKALKKYLEKEGIYV